MARRALNGQGLSVWQFLIALVVLTATLTAGWWFLAVHHLGATRSSELLWEFEFRMVLAWWVSFDWRACELRVPFEFDAFVFFAWPFLVPWYLYRTRGWRGLLLVAGIYGLYILPFLATAIARLA